VLLEEPVEEIPDLERAVEVALVEQAEFLEVRLAVTFRGLTRVNHPGVVLGVAVGVLECIE